MIESKLSLNHVTWRDDPFLEIAHANGWHVEHRPFHQLLVESLGAAGPSALQGITVSKLFDHGFGNQTLLSYEIVGTQDGNLGAVIPTGSASRFDHSGRYERLFNDDLEDYLLLSGFKGWISFSTSVGGITGVAHGLPFFTNWAWLESMDRRPEEWLQCPSRLLESWTVALLVSKFPFPLQTTAQAEFEVVSSPEQRRHFSLLFPRGASSLGTTRTRSLAIGVASGWSKSLSEAGRRAEGVARRVGVEGKQLRTDVSEVVEGLLRQRTLDIEGKVAQPTQK